MDIESLRQTLELANLASLAAGFVIGFLFGFNPVALAAIPVSLAYASFDRRLPNARPMPRRSRSTCRSAAPAAR